MQASHAAVSLWSQMPTISEVFLIATPLASRCQEHRTDLYKRLRPLMALLNNLGTYLFILFCSILSSNMVHKLTQDINSQNFKSSSKFFISVNH